MSLSRSRWGSFAIVAGAAAAFVVFAVYGESSHPALASTKNAVSAAVANSKAKSSGTKTDARVTSSLPVIRKEPAPDLNAPGSEWLNTDGKKLDVRGKVVLYDFWTFGCSNCKATLPYVKAWHAAYQQAGFVIASIHTPEFEYESKRSNVESFVRENAIAYPVVLDPDRKIWKSFANHYWPAFYLYDKDNQLRRIHFGEGKYKEMEAAIRELLRVPASFPKAKVPSR